MAKRSAAEILASLKIRAKSTATGDFKTTCPNCSHRRKKKSDPCLSVTIDHEGVKYNCWHCETFHGVEPYDAEQKTSGVVGGPRDQRGNRRSFADLQREARAGWVRRR